MSSGKMPRIVYYGADAGGKSTNLQYINQVLPQIETDAAGNITNAPSCGPIMVDRLIPKFIKVGDEVVLNLEPVSADQAPIYKYMLLHYGTVGGIARTINNYALPLELNDPGYRIIMNADAIVFVVDSDPGRMEANKQAVHTLTHLEQVTANIVVQYNKRDLETALPLEVLSKECNPWQARELEAVAAQGLGVLGTSKACLALLF